MQSLQKNILKKHSKAHLLFFCTLLIFIGMIGSLTIDMYVPSLPAIAKSFSASAVAVKYTMTIYLITYGIGQLFYGTIIDCFGRKRILLLAVVIGTLGSVFCIFASSVFELYLGRLLQGAGYAAIGVAAPAMARDILDERQFAQAASLFSLAFGLGPIFSPIIGSYIGYLFGWRSVFVFISGYSLLVFISILLFIPETLNYLNRHEFHITAILKNYWKIVTNSIFIANTGCKSIAYTGFIVFYAVTPFMLQDHLHLTIVEYGWVTLTLTSTILLAKFANTILLRYISINQLILFSSYTLVTGGGLLLIFGLLHYYSVMTLLLPFMIFGFGTGFLFANTTVAAYVPFKGLSSGTVSGLMNSFQLIFAFIASSFAVHLPLETLFPLGLFMTVISVGAVALYLYLNK